MRNFWLILSVLWLWTCSGGGDGESPTEPTGPNYVVNLSNLGGSAQKGPFNNGTSINVAELSNALAPTGKNYSSQITDNSGRFNVAQVQLESPYVELRANGYYFNEVSNQVSSGQLTLYAISNLSGKTSLNVNILTHLEKNRIINLMSGDNPLTYAQAKLQAQEEVLNIFEYSRANMPESELLDISKSGSANAKLLAISAILQGDQTVGQMSELLANISTDITADGTIENTTIRNTLINNAANLDFEQIRSNLVARYASLGVSATIPDFETEINTFLKPPVANNMNVSTDEDNPINITLDASDPEGESLTFQIVETNNATVNINGNVANYTPDANFNGTDTFTYFANDGTVNSNTATVTITVGAVDDEPNTNDVTTTTDEDTDVVFTLTADEYDGDSYSFAIITQPSNGSANLDGSSVTYSPNENWNGTDSFTFEASDDTGRIMNVATATINVNAINDVPVVYDSTITIQEDAVVILNDRGTNKQSQHIFIVTDIDSDIQWPNMEFSWDSTGDGSINFEPYDTGQYTTYTPTKDFNGTTSIIYKATDSDGGVSENKSITINVEGVNDAPTTENYSVSTDEDLGIYSIPITEYSADAENDDLVYIVTQIPTNGNLCQDGGAVCGTVIAVGDTIVGENGTNSSQPVYEPNQDFNGSDSFSWKVNDGEYDSNISTVNITVNPTNDAPVSSDTSIATRENVPVVVTFDAADIDGDNLTYSILTQPTNGTLSTGNNVDYAYTPNNSFIGTDTFTYVANDGTVNSNTSTVTVTVIAGSAPIAVPLNLNVGEVGSTYDFTTDLSVAASDPDGDPLTYYIDSQPDIGSATIDGSIVTYTVDQTQIGNIYETTMTWYANDGANNSNIATLYIKIDYTLGGYIVDISEYDHDAYTSNFTSGLRTADVSYMGDSNAGTTGFFVGNRAGDVNVKTTLRDFDRFDYWQDKYSLEFNFNESSLAWDYLNEDIVGFVPFSMYIIDNETAERIRLFVGVWDQDDSNSWTLDINRNEPVYDYNTMEVVYAWVPSDINAPYDPNKIGQYTADNSLAASGGCGWGSSGYCNFPDDYLPGDNEINYPFVTGLLFSHKNTDNVPFGLIAPTATNQSTLNTGYTTGSAIYFKTEKSSSKAPNKNLGPVFIESTIDDGFDDYEYIEK